MNTLECKICDYRFEEKTRIPKNLPCGHLYCLKCLSDAPHPKTCFECRRHINISPECLPTNFTILSDASDTSQSLQFFCSNCKKGASWECEKEGHSLMGYAAYYDRQIESHHKNLEQWSQGFDGMLPKVLHLKDIVDAHARLTAENHERAQTLMGRLNSLKSNMKGSQGGSSALDSALKEARECTLRMPILETSLQVLGLDKGSCQLQLQSESGTWAASVDLSTLAVQRPEILAVGQFFFHLLAQEKYMQNKQPAPGRYRGPQSKAVRAQGQGDGLEGSPPRNVSVANPSDGWKLDLEALGVGDAGFGEKTALKNNLLKSSEKVRELVGLKCDKDPGFSSKIIQHHAQTLETLTIHRIKQEHFNLLGSLRRLKYLKVVGNDGRLESNLPRLQDSQLQSLYMSLPVPVQLSLWDAYASSVKNVTLRMETVTWVNPQASLRKFAQLSPNLRTLQLHRMKADEHTPTECGRQMDSLREVLPGVRLSCNMCQVTATGIL